MHVPQTEIILCHAGAELVHVILPPGKYIIGRAPESEIYAETPLLSRQHARLTLNHDHLLIEDLGSSNGTFVNEMPVTAPTRLFPNQSIRLGPDITLEVRRQRTLTEPDTLFQPVMAAIRRHLPEELLEGKRYTIGGIVAQGGMGAILDARQTAIDRTVAMKVMLDTGDEASVLRFIDEAKITGQLEHPNIVPIYELGVDEQDHVFYTMKFVRGITFTQVLGLLAQGNEPTVKRYPLAALLTIFQKVCDALAFAHSKGVIHRDLKPENLMLGDFGSVLVMDWGLAKLIGSEAASSVHQVMSVRAAEPDFGSTMTGSIMGTPQYMSPEQARGEIELLDARSDIYALGAILFHILLLRPPYSGNTAMEIVGKVTRGEVEWPTARELRALPDSLHAICRKALALNPAARYPRVEDLQTDLLAYQTGFATSAEKAGAWKQFRLLIKRHKALTGGVAAVLLVGSVFGTGAIREGRRAERALTELKAAIPTFLEQAQTLLGQQRYDEAIAKLDFALTIDDRDANVLRLRGDYLQSALRLKDAAAIYRRVLDLGPDARAKANLILCERLLSQYGDAALPDPALDQLWTALLVQKRDAEAMPLTVRLAKSKELLLPMIRSRLKAWSELPKWTGPEGDRVLLRDGRVEVRLTDLTITDLEPLRGLPIERLSLRFIGVTDLRPLAGMRLRWLELSAGKMRDLSPLAGMPLEWITLDDSLDLDLTPLRGCPLKTVVMYNSRITDIGPLRDCPLDELIAGGSQIRSVEPLRGHPLKRLMLFACENITDITPLKDCTELEELGIPKNARNIEFLRHMPNLKKLCIDSPTPIPAAEFWADYDAKQAAGKR